MHVCHCMCVCVCYYHMGDVAHENCGQRCVRS